MAKKSKTFVDKLAKTSEKAANNCPVCGKPITPVLYVTSVKSPRTGAWKFNQRTIKLCKCNEKEILG